MPATPKALALEPDCARAMLVTSVRAPTLRPPCAPVETDAPSSILAIVVLSRNMSRTEPPAPAFPVAPMSIHSANG